MGLKIAVIAGGAFEAERSLAAANDVMAALKEAEHEPELFQADGSLIDDLLRAQPDAAISCLRGGDGESGDTLAALSASGRPWGGSSASARAALPTTRGRSPRRSRRTTTSRRTWSRQRFRKL